MGTMQKADSSDDRRSSETTRALLTRIIGSDRRLRLAAAVASGEDALRQLESVAPDVISMDIELPGMDGIETTRRSCRSGRRPS